MTPTDQIAQTVQNVVAQPIDKLAVIIGLLGVAGIMLLAVGGGYFIYRLFKYLSNPESPLVKSFNGIRDAFNGLKGEQAKVVTATNETNRLLSEQTGVIRGLTDFQKANNETVGNLNDNVEKLDKTVTELDTRVGNVEKDVQEVKNTVQAIKSLIEDRIPPADCVDVEKQLEAFQNKMIGFITATGENKVIKDDPPAELPLEGAA